MSNGSWLAAVSRRGFAEGEKKQAAGNRLISHAASLRTVVQICILTAAMFTAPCRRCFLNIGNNNKSALIFLWRAPRFPSPAPALHGIRGAIRSRFGPTRFFVYRSRVLRSALIIGLVIFNARAPKCQAGSVPFVCLFGASSSWSADKTLCALVRGRR